MAEWQNRIIGYKQIAANQLLANPDNPRRHPAKQREALRGSMDTLGIVAPVLLNVQTGYLLDGHARVEEALAKDENMLLPVLEVDISEAEEKIFLASFDWITTLADYDKDVLDNLLHDAQTDDARLQAMLSELAETNDLYFGDGEPLEDESLYSRKVEAPIYAPSDSKPSISDLFNDDKTKKLVAEIQASDELTDDEKEFLIIAAQRHTILNFSKVADYYAHSSEYVQNIMENSALVIIDFDKAIELGFVKLSNDIAALEKEDYG